MKNFNFITRFMVLLMVIFFTSCEQDQLVTPSDNVSLDERTSTLSYVPSFNFYGLGTSNEIYVYRSGPPATELTNLPVKGLVNGEFLLAIDIRPATKGLYGVSNMNKIYVIKMPIGTTSEYALAVAVSLTPFSPGIEGSTVGFDFNPKDDRISLITDKGQRLRIHPGTGKVISSQNIGTSSPPVGINSIAYGGNSYTLTGSGLYAIDGMTGALYSQNSLGSSTHIGSTGLTIVGEGGFDISKTGSALGVFLASSNNIGIIGTTDDMLSEEAYRVYSFNLKSGQARNLGKVKPMIGLAIQ